MNCVHISTARRIMNSGEFSISWLTQAGELRHADRAVSLRYDFNSGTRSLKILFDDKQPQIRRIRDSLIISVNDIEVYL